MSGSILHDAASGHSRSKRDAVMPLAIALGAAAVVVAAMGLGVLSIPGLGALLLLAAVVTPSVLYWTPGVLVLIVPASLPLPYLPPFLPFEFALLVLFATMLTLGIRRDAFWVWRLENVEVTYVALIAWAAFTGLWCTDARLYLWGLRTLSTGLVAFWVAFRLARLVPRRLFEWSVLAVVYTLSLATLGRRLSTGLSGGQLLVGRAKATDLGWGWANYIAALLLIMAPVLLNFAQNARMRWDRVSAWVAIPLMAVVQGVIIARGALLLFSGGLFAQVLSSQPRRRLIGIGFVLVGIGILLFGPIGQGILFRFTDLRELSSGTIRLWYFREAWRRTLAALPWGIGVNQGRVYPDHLQGMDPHNYWLVLSSELGPIGVLAWGVVLVVLWRRIRAMAVDPAGRSDGRTLQVVFWLAQLHCLIEPTFQGSQYQFIFFWIMGGYLGYHAVVARSRIALVSRDRNPFGASLRPENP